MESLLILKSFRLAHCMFLLVSLLLFSTRVVADEWIYTVNAGDNLWSISEQHLISTQYVTRLQQLNKISDAYTIPPGTKIRVPVAWSKTQTSGVYAQVVHVRGSVLIKRKNAAEFPAETGMKLNTGDEVRSENDSFVTLKFFDNSRLRLQENSQIRIDEMKVLGDYGAVDTLIELQQGRTENAVPQKSGTGTRFRIKTPSAVSSVRGTDFRVGTTTKGEHTSSEVLSGLVQVEGGEKEIAVSAGFGTITALGAPPVAPVKLLPAPDLSNTPVLYEHLPLVITLNPLAGAATYRAQIANDQNFQNLWTEFTTDKLPFRDGDIPDGNYWLRVRGIDAAGIEGHDATIAFTLNARPEPPFIIAPLPDGVVDPIKREFQWSIQPEAAYYRVMISQDSGFTTTTMDNAEVTNNTFLLTDPLPPGHYFWRIASVSATEGAGPFTDAMSFRLPFPGPTMEEAKFDKTQMTFAWRAGGDDQSFHFQLARDETFNQILYDEKTSATQLTVTRPDGGQYFLRTKTIEADGFEGPWGPPQKIDIPYANPYWLLLPFAPLIDLLL
ncbi:MAG: FecR domain-containing protein [Nitrosomonas sp.]|uniref:FecR domain-containing protein n=1 Tax=Nitrosomonas sp. TaxID=42353 RepID=UPI0025F67C99|nr:FecR domain-containing protein [Nitrosomonas sp.]MBY0473501.1 FecR domain-containing protein [Nitrosomonas sp.]